MSGPVLQRWPIAGPNLRWIFRLNLKTESNVFKVVLQDKVLDYLILSFTQSIVDWIKTGQRGCQKEEDQENPKFL